MLKEKLLSSKNVQKMLNKLSYEDKECTILTYILSSGCMKERCVYIITDD